MLGALARGGLLILGLVAAMALAGCQEAADLNGRPVETTITMPVETRRTPIQVAEEFDAAGLIGEIEAVLPAGLASLSSRLRAAVCAESGADEACRDARLSGAVLRDGPVELASDARGLAVRIPLRYDLKLQPSGKNAIAATRSGRLVVEASLGVELDEAWRPRLLGVERFRWPETPTVKLLGVPVDLGREVESALARHLKRLPDGLLANLPFAALQARTGLVWRHLHAPLQVSAEPETWLRGEPVEVRFAGLAVEPARPGRAELRAVVVTRLRQFLAERPIPLLPRLLPSPVRSDGEAPDGLPLSFDVAYPELARAGQAGLRAAFAGNDRLTGGRVELFPAGTRTGLALGLSLERPGGWWPLGGRANYLATFRLADGERQLRIGEIELFDPSAVPAHLKADLAILQEPAVLDKLRQSVALDVGAQIERLDAMVLAFAQGGFGKGQRLRIAGRAWHVPLIEPRPDGLRVHAELRGEIVVGGAEAEEEAAAAGQEADMATTQAQVAGTTDQAAPLISTP